MGRIYVATFTGVAVSVQQDLFELVPSSAVVACIHEIHITNSASETSEQLPVSVQRLTGGTTGSGGSTLTVAKKMLGDPTSVCTVKANNSTRATGTRITVGYQGDNVLNGWHWFYSPETRLYIPPSGMLTIGLEATPGASLTVNGELVYEEIG